MLALLPFYVGLVFLDANAATATAAGLALIGAVWTLSHADATTRRALTAEYRARWDHPDLLEARVVAAEFLDLTNTDEDTRWQERTTTMTMEKRVQLMAILNYWEEVASAYNQDFLDSEWFRTDLAWQLEHNWNRAKWFIRKYRVEEVNAAFYSEWQIALESIKADVERQLDQGRRLAEEALARGEDLLEVRQQPVR